MPFLIKQGKTNIKYLLIVFILAAVIGGGVLWWSHFEPIPICGTPLLPKEDETADWETYRNEEYGFEFLYPLDWQFIEDFSGSFIGGPVSGIVPKFQYSPINIQLEKVLEEAYVREHYPEWPVDFVPGGSCTIQIITSIDIDENFNQAFGEACQDPVTTRTRNIIVGEEEAIYCIFGTGPAAWEAVWILRDNKGTAFVFSHLSPEDCEAVFNQILSTFRFLE